jgi:hypothetical protein
MISHPFQEYTRLGAALLSRNRTTLVVNINEHFFVYSIRRTLPNSIEYEGIATILPPRITVSDLAKNYRDNLRDRNPNIRLRMSEKHVKKLFNRTELTPSLIDQIGYNTCKQHNGVTWRFGSRGFRLTNRYYTIDNELQHTQIQATNPRLV